jgi:hypothetical protein
MNRGARKNVSIVFLRSVLRLIITAKHSSVVLLSSNITQHAFTYADYLFRSFILLRILFASPQYTCCNSVFFYFYPVVSLTRGPGGIDGMILPNRLLVAECESHEVVEFRVTFPPKWVLVLTQK